MTQEDKELLLKDLCARLPYRIICEDGYGNILELNDVKIYGDITKNMDKDQLVQAYIEALIEGKLDPMSIHGEVLIMNQIRAVDDILAKPDWEYPNAPYQILTLDHALMNNPSVTITLLYQKLSKILTSPKTFEKTAPSIVDPFFMEKPQDFFFTDAKLITTRNPKSDKEQNLIKPFVVTNVPESDNALV